MFQTSHRELYKTSVSSAFKHQNFNNQSFLIAMKEFKKHNLKIKILLKRLKKEMTITTRFKKYAL